MKHLTVLLCLLFAWNVYGQRTSYIKAGTHFPQQFSFQYEQGISQKFSLSLEAGAMLKPYDKLVVGVLKNMNTNRAVLELAQNYFEGALVIGVKGNYNLGKSGKFYTSVFGQHISLHLSNAARPFMESHFSKRPSKAEIEINTQLYQLGALIGRRFELSNRLGLNVEVSCSKTIDTATKMSLATPEVTPVTGFVAQEIHGTFMKYGYMPTLNVFVSYKIAR